MRTILHWIFGAATSALLVGSVAPALPHDAQPPSVDRSLVPYADLGDAVRLPGGRTIHLVCMGQGKPTVIFTAGSGDWSGTWSKVQPEIARHTRTCAWDRAGFGLSSPPATPQTAIESTADLTDTLRLGLIVGPYILVGHSGGAFESLMLADAHPDDIAGIVLVDPSFPDETDRLERVTPAQTAYMANLPEGPGLFLRKCADDLRAAKIRPGGPDPDGCMRTQWPASDPPELIAARRRMLAQASAEEIARGLDTLRATDLAMLARNAKLAINPARDYRDMPLIVLTRTIFQIPPDYPEAAKAEIPVGEAEWNRGHDELAALSTRGINARVPGTGHAIHSMKPQVVIDAIEQVVREARTAD